MADLSPVREASPPAPRPASPTLVPAEETTPLISTSTAATAEDETAPLLSTSTSAPSDTPVAGAFFASKAIYRLTILALTFSVATLVLLGVTLIVAQIVLPGYYLPYHVSQSFSVATFLVLTISTVCLNMLIHWSVRQTIASLCISSVNISRQRSNRVPATLGINLLFDLIISYYIIIYSAEGLAQVEHGYDGFCYYPERDRPACLRRRLPIRILAALALATALLVGVFHLILFVIRCVAAYRTKFWRRPWKFPTGELTLQFTVKLLREPQGEVAEGVV